MPSRLAPYGTWASPLTAAAVAAGGLRLSAVLFDGEDIYWLEGRPREGGRYVLVRRGAGGSMADVTPPEVNVRSRVHEYGGGAYTVHERTVYFVNFADQRVYRLEDGGTAAPLTPPGAWFYADLEVDARHSRLICVREDHGDPTREPINALVAIPVGPAKAGRYDNFDDAPLSAGEILASGYDFYSTPRLSPDGSRLAWLSWRHPLMPWDGTELWVADLDDTGASVNATLIAGGTRESIYQPGWAPDGTLYFISDRDGWWKIYRSGRSDRSIEPVVRNAPPDAEFGRPDWVFGTATWRFAGPSRLVASYTRKGRWHLATADATSGRLADLAPDLQPHDWLAANATHAVLVAGFAAAPDAVVRVDLASGHLETLREASTERLDPGYISAADPIEFPTSDGDTAHAFFYAPRNRDFRAPAGEAPPLVVITHGGPTAATEPTLHLEVQFWTSRGFAVVDVNYRGSSGYGRAYRERLNGRWGVVDVADVVNATRYFSTAGRVDPERLIIRGGSAGGYTTLAALTFHPEVFKAGASYYGISDLEVLELDTHKFESRYSHSLIGPYPEAKAVYRARSPIHAIDRLACPLILFQGLEDKVVPPNQSQMMADAVRAKGLPVAYLAFEGEQHGFRKADTIIRSLETELYFYGKVFGFTPADRIEPVPVANMDA
ncbi:MAG: S9 family peptidase [Acidobacteria bacterium]|nr:S9 family peptidase [Acidobacteriota bacterium]